MTPLPPVRPMLGRIRRAKLPVTLLPVLQSESDGRIGTADIPLKR
jgi:hypothetical protein